MKTFHKKVKLKEIVTSNSALQKILKGILHTEEGSELRQNMQESINHFYQADQSTRNRKNLNNGRIKTSGNIAINAFI
jgi:DNA-binding transcriptional regulator GbsR (MarR family)